MAKKKHFTADEIMQYISWRISLARAEEDYETVNFFRRLGVSVIKTMYEDTRPLTPEILINDGWEDIKVKQSYCREFDKYEEFNDGMINCISVTFRTRINRIAIDYSRYDTVLRVVKPQPITVGEFNTLLDIVKLDKFKLCTKTLTKSFNITDKS
jgi:hypothetical protein